jgi:hypothetical protein
MKRFLTPESSGFLLLPKRSFRNFMEHGGSLLCLQEPAIGAYPEPQQTKQKTKKKTPFASEL